jgi:hypothetical protein
MDGDRDQRGRFVKGGKPPARAGRPKGSINAVTRTLRQEIEAAFVAKGGIQAFVEHLIIEFPAVAAALLSKLLPPVEVEEAIKNAGGTVVVNVMPIQSGTYIVNDPKPIDDAVLMLEHSKEEAAAPAVEIMRPEPEPVARPIEPEDGGNSGVVLVRSRALRRRAGHPFDRD